MQGIEKKKDIFSENFDWLMETKMKIEKLQPESARLLCERGLNRTGRGYSWNRDKKLKVTSPLHMTEEQVLSFLRKIQSPVLGIQARSGYILPRGVLEKRVRSIPNIKLVTLRGGHHIHMENTQPVFREIEKFLNDLNPKTLIP